MCEVFFKLKTGLKTFVRILFVPDPGKLHSPGCMAGPVLFFIKFYSMFKSGSKFSKFVLKRFPNFKTVLLSAVYIYTIHLYL